MTADLARLREWLNRAPSHYYCEDRWYSCPKAEDGCADDRKGPECDCGAEAEYAIRQEIAAFLTELEQLRETTLQQAHHQRVVGAAAAAIAEERDRYRADAERLREALRSAEIVIDRGVELMTDEQVGQWDGVRHWLEFESFTDEIDAAKDAK